jgi:hypothetical protein
LLEGNLMTRRLTLTVSAFALGLAVSLQPLSLNLASLKLEKLQAQAKGGDGGGNGGGNGGDGGNGGGNSGGGNSGGNSGNGGGNAGGGGHGGSSGGGNENSRSSGASERSDRSSDAGKGSAYGQSRAEQARSSTRDAKEGGGKVSSDAKKAAASAKSIGLDTAKLGRMNAVNASATARQHAAPNSTVGLVAAYEKALSVSGTTEDQVTDAEIAEAAKALAALSKTGVPEEPVKVLNERLGLEIDPASDLFDRVIDEARDLQASRQ